MKQVKKIAIRHGILDYPAGRKAHTKPIPLLGGVAIWFGATSTLAIAMLAFFFILLPTAALPISKPIMSIMAAFSANLVRMLAVVIGGTTLVVVGYFDDTITNGLHYRTKLIAESSVALLIAGSGIHFEIFPFPWLNTIVTIFWLIGIINAFNLLDGLDGLAAGVSIVASLAFFLIAVLHQDVVLAIILSLGIGSTLGFFRYNSPPASIFMGDSGSLFLGFLLGVEAILISNLVGSTTHLVNYLVPVVVLLQPIGDTMAVSLIRIKKGKSIFFADRNHLHHRLLDLGLSVKNAVTAIIIITVYISFNAITAIFVSSLGSAMIFAQTIFLFIGLYCFLCLTEKKLREKEAIEPVPFIRLTRSILVTPKEQMLN